MIAITDDPSILSGFLTGIGIGILYLAMMHYGYKKARKRLDEKH